MPWCVADKDGYVLKVYGDGEKALRLANRARKDGQFVVYSENVRSAGDKVKLI